VEQSVRYQDAVLYFQISGNGPKPLLVFHGFGQSKQVFLDTTQTLTERYTLYIFDLFFHGKSEWNYGEKPMEKEFWNQLIQQFLTQQNIQSFSVLGYSMGGKFALATTEGFPERVKGIFLVAPDGIKTSTWYSLATYPLALRNLFKSMVLKPERFQFITSLAHKLRLIDKGILRFAETQMDTEQKRKQVYFSWVVFRHLKFDLAKIAGLINSHDIQLTIVIGKYDKIITAKNMKRLLKRVRQYNLEILETGHTGLITKLGTL
jgi:pimeloyl-ACP methyl ester carboxylesterase